MMNQLSQHMLHGMGRYYSLVRPRKLHVPGLLHNFGLLLRQKIFLENCTRRCSKKLRHRVVDSLCIFLPGITRNFHIYRQPGVGALQR